MKVKSFEVRDEGTCIPVLAVKTEPANDAERYLLSRMGYGKTPEAQGRFVLLSPLSGDKETHYDPNHWGNWGRTMEIAHRHIREHFDELENASVVDVEFILGEKTELSKPSSQEWAELLGA